MECFFKVLGKYADFSGRAQRKEFWMFMLFYIAFGIDAIVIEALLAGDIENDIPICLAVYVTAMLLPLLAVTVRRLHDTGKSGWWILVRLIPVAGTIGLFIWLFRDSQKDSNRYGDNPKTTPQQAPSEETQLTSAGVTIVFVSILYLISDIISFNYISASANATLFVGVIIAVILHLLFLFTGILLLMSNPYTSPVEGAKRKIFLPLLIYGVIMTIMAIINFILQISTSSLHGFVAIAFYLTIVLQNAAIVFFASVLNSSKELLKTASVILIALSGIMIVWSILMIVEISTVSRYIDSYDSLSIAIIAITLLSISLILLARVFMLNRTATGGYSGQLQPQPTVSQPTTTGGYSGQPQPQPPVSQPTTGSYSGQVQPQPPVSQPQPSVSQPQPSVSQPQPPVSQPAATTAATGGGYTGKTYYERDNRGMRVETMEQSVAYWIGERMQNARKDPFVYYTFANSDDARNAMLALPFIHLAVDTGKIICDEMFRFGYFAVTSNGMSTGEYDAFVAGADFTLEQWQKTGEIFRKYNGVKKNDLAPEASSQTTSPTVSGDATKVKFVREDRDNTAVWRVYSASDKADALAFLSQQTVTRPLFYVVVETPDGNFGKDKDGIYQE